MMATEKRLYDVLKHRLECHIAKAIYYGVKDIPMGKDSNSAVEFLRGYERGAIETANIALDLVFKDTVEVVHGRWVDRYGEKYANHLYECSECHKKAAYKFEDDSLHIGMWVQDLTDYCPNCGADMRERKDNE